MPAPVKLITVTPLGNQIELTFKRWFQTREFWVNGSGWAVTVLPSALTLLNALALSAAALLIWTIIIQSVLFLANQYLKNTSTSLVINRDAMNNVRDEAAQNVAPATPTN